MSAPTTEVAPPTSDDHGFTVRSRKRWPWIVGGIVLVVAIAAAVVIPRLVGTPSPNLVEGATLTVVTAEGNAAEEDVRRVRRSQDVRDGRRPTR